MGKKKAKKSYSTFREMPIDEFDCFVACVVAALHNTPGRRIHEMEQFYFNRIAREFHFVFQGEKRNTNEEDRWTYDSNNVYPKWARISYENVDSPWTHAVRYRFYVLYKLICLYFFNDESLLEDLYKRALKEAYKQEKYFKKHPEYRFDENYCEEFSIAGYVEDLLKSALSVRSGMGQLIFSTLYKTQEKNLGWFKAKKRKGYVQRIERKIKPTSKSILSQIFYRCMGESQYRAAKAINEVATKIDAFLKRKEKERNDEGSKKSDI